MSARVLATGMLCLALATCVGEPSGPRSSGPRAADVVPASTEVLLSAGNIASCGGDGDQLTAQILDTIPGTVLTAGDNAFPNGTLTDYQNCYGPSWGRHKDRTFATLGNNEYDSGTADGSFDYFGDRAGPRGKGYYSFDRGDWHIIVLNSNRNFVPLAAGSEQDQWLQADLAANTKLCTLAAFHQPRFFSSNFDGFTSSGPVKIFWDRLYAAGADVVLSAQEHHYERLAPMTPDGVVDAAHGLREFNVGTGGESVAMPTAIAASSEMIGSAFGVLKLTLLPDRYTWEFVPAAGETFTDSGSGTCHDAPGSPPPANHPPTAAAGGPYPGTEGAAVSFDGSASADADGDALTYAWSFGDGSSGSGTAPTHIYADNGAYTVSLTVTDTHAGSSSPATTTATIANAAPTVNAGASQTVGILAEYTLNATFHDPGGNDAPWSYAIDWGDGTPLTTGSTTNQADAITARHLYLLPATYSVGVTVTDKDGGSGSGGTTVTVALPLGQTISFDPLPVRNFGDPPFSLSATASSGLPVSYTVGSGDHCTIAGSTVTITGAGSCSVTATQPGDGTYAAAAPVAQTFAIGKATPLLVWNSPPSTMVYGTPLSAASLDATATGVGGAGLAGAFTYTPGPGAVLEPGTQTVSATFLPADAANYTAASTSARIAVFYNTAVGHTLLPPITRSLPAIKVYQLGSTIPVKFQLFYPDGLTPVSIARGTIRVILMATPISGPLDEIVAAASPNQGVGFRYDVDKYVFNLGTDTWRPGIHQVTVTLDDGSTMVGMVGIKTK